MGKKLKEYVNPKINKTRMIAYMGLLIALDIVLTRLLSLEPMLATWRISIGFLPTSVTGYILGPIWGAVEAVIADIVGYFMFYKGEYPFFLGYTFSALMRGLIYGLVLYKCKGSNISIIIKCVISVFIIFVCIDVALNSYWSTFMTKNPYWVCLIRNLPSAAINFAIRCVLMPFMMIFMKNNHKSIFGRNQ